MTDPTQPVDPSASPALTQHPGLAQQLSYQPQSSPPPTPKKGRARQSKILLAVACTVVLASCAAIGVTVWQSIPSTDSGVKECKLLASDRSTGGFSEAKYQAARKRFSDSRYSDIQAAGTKLLDVIWTSTRGGRVDVSTADSGPFFSGYADLTNRVRQPRCDASAGQCLERLT